MNTEINEKTDRLSALMTEIGLDGLLINGQHNFAWLTCGASNGIDLSRENGVATILIRSDGKRYLLANNIEMPRMMSENIPPTFFEPIEFTWQKEKADGALAIDTAKMLCGSKIASDILLHPYAETIENLIAPLRHQLTDPELERYRKLGYQAATAVEDVVDKIAPGETELEIAAKLRNELENYGITSVVTLIAADERIAKYRHPVPTSNQWKKNLLMVTCARKHGLIASLSRIISVGKPPDELQKKTESAAYVSAALHRDTKPGVKGRDLYSAAASAYASVGYTKEIDLHHQGGASGYETREWVADPASNEVVKMAQAFAWNPSITGTKVEETCIVTENGTETITTSPKFPVIRSVVGDFEHNSPGILII